jgi:hypothetical protein
MHRGQHQGLFADDARHMALPGRIFADKVGCSSSGGFYFPFARLPTP